MVHHYQNRVAELAERYGRMVFATAHRILGNAHDAEDALQEVFLKTLASWPQRRTLDDVKDWGAYLRVVATRAALDLLRNRLRRNERCGRLPQDIEDPSVEDPESRAHRLQKAHALRRAISMLKKRDAQVFVLRHFEDSSYEEIASQTGLSVSQVGVILHRTRKRLQDMLQPASKPGSAGTEARTSAAGVNKGDQHDER
jgi:RNA polymerase sigma-70 factor (ECF subfamily)